MRIYYIFLQIDTIADLHKSLGIYSLILIPLTSFVINTATVVKEGRLSHASLITTNEGLVFICISLFMGLFRDGASWRLVT